MFVFVASYLDETEVENEMGRWLSFAGGGVWCTMVAGFVEIASRPKPWGRSRRPGSKAMAHEGVRYLFLCLTQTFEHQSFESEFCYTFRCDDFVWSIQKSMKSKRKHGDRAQPPNTCRL
ncbi:hypothetical protein Q3G72_017596 [Acer saccharum]|nr:hypothetical protein Q3G72_017596 [Acer saccharum]